MVPPDPRGTRPSLVGSTCLPLSPARASRQVRPWVVPARPQLGRRVRAVQAERPSGALRGGVGGPFPLGVGRWCRPWPAPGPGSGDRWAWLTPPASPPLVPIPGLISLPPPRAHPGSEPGCPECFSGNQPEGRLSCLAAVAR